jgi:hypothetical protein
MKSFKRIHMIFAVFLIVAFVSVMCLITWLGDLHELDDHTQFDLWKPRVEAFFYAPYTVVILWLLFTVYHLMTLIRKKS